MAFLVLVRGRHLVVVVVLWRATEVVSPILVVPTPVLPICARATSEDSAESEEEVGGLVFAVVVVVGEDA